MIFELAEDFADALAAMPPAHGERRTLELFEEAIHRDIQFIGHYPTTLFQCMWNSCWWHDCPDAEHHYAKHDEAAVDEDEPQKLCEKMSMWRIAKRLKTPGFRWVRSLRPNAVPLASQQEYVLRSEEWDFNAVAFSHDERLIVALTPKRALLVWDVRTSELVRSIPVPAAKCMVHSPTENYVACGTEDGEVRVFDTLSGAEACQLRSQEGEAIWAINWASDKNRIVAGSSKGTLIVWDVDDRREIDSCIAHDQGVRSVTITSDGRHVASGAWDETVRMRNVDEGRFISTMETPNYSTNCVEFSPDGSHLAVGMRISSLIHYHLNRKVLGPEKVPPFALLALLSTESDAPARVVFQDTESSEKGVTSVRFSRDGSNVAVASRDGIVWVVRVSDGRELQVLRGHTLTVNDVAVGETQDVVATASQDGTVRVWTRSERGGDSVRLGHNKEVFVEALSQNGARAASTCWDNSVCIWCTSGGAPVMCTPGHTEPAAAVALSSDGHLVITGSRDNTVRVWDAETGAQIHCFAGHGEEVNAVAISPCGELAVSGSSNSVKIWNLRDGSLHGELPLPKIWLGNVEFSPDGERVLVWRRGGTKQVVEFDRDTLEPLETHDGPTRIWLDDSVNYSYDVQGKYKVESMGPHACSLHEEGQAAVAWIPKDIYLARSNAETSIFVGSTNKGKDFFMLKLECETPENA